MKTLRSTMALPGAVLAVLFGITVFTGCPQKNSDGMETAAVPAKFTVNFTEKETGGTVYAKIKNGAPLTSPALAAKGTIIIFTAEPEPGYNIESWSGITASPPGADKVELKITGDVNVKVRFANFVPEDFITVPVPENGITGIETNYILPDTDEWWKGVFVKDRKIKLSPYAVAVHEVTYKLWYEVREWAEQNGYSFAKKGSGGSMGFDGEAPAENKNHPVTKISWRDCIIWCNAYTHMKNGKETECVYRKGKTEPAVLKNAAEKDGAEFVCDKVFADISKKGFRLPTEAEWEFAARYEGNGTLPRHRINAEEYGAGVWLTKLHSAGGAVLPIPDEKIPKPEDVTYAQLNEETSRTALFGLWWNGTEWEEQTPASDGTAPVGSKEANPLGIFDMSGNVFEWCFDCYDDDPQKNDSAYLKDGIITDPQGASNEETSNRVCRGGAYMSKSYHCAVGSRNTWASYLSFSRAGFRLACSL